MGTVAEYGTLCLGTNPDKALLENTCAGIKSKATLQTLVGVRETSASGGSKHLELTILPMNHGQGEEKMVNTYKYGASRGELKEIVTPVPSPLPFSSSTLSVDFSSSRVDIFTPHR